jgi:hypothetical protein
MKIIVVLLIEAISGRTIRPVYGAVLLCPRLRQNTVRLRRRMKQIYGENTGTRID